MANLTQSRGAQKPLVAEFTFDVSTAANDAMPTVVGNVIGGASINPYGANANVAFGGIATNIFEVIALPPGAVVIGGDLVVETAVAGPTASTISIGDSGSATRYLGATSLLSAARTVLLLPAFRSLGANIRITVVNTVAAATVGVVTVRVMYTVRNRLEEASPS